MLHLTKVAVGCPDVATLTRLQRETWGDALHHQTRYMPKRADEMIGSSLFWIIRHRIVARQPMLGFTMVETEWGPKCRIALGAPPIPVDPLPKRAHQGWRYLSAEDAPVDLGDAGSSEALPAGMVRELQALWIL